MHQNENSKESIAESQSKKQKQGDVLCILTFSLSDSAQELCHHLEIERGSTVGAIAFQLCQTLDCPYFPQIEELVKEKLLQVLQEGKPENQQKQEDEWRKCLLDVIQSSSKNNQNQIPKEQPDEISRSQSVSYFQSKWDKDQTDMFIKKQNQSQKENKQNKGNPNNQKRLEDNANQKSQENGIKLVKQNLENRDNFGKCLNGENGIYQRGIMMRKKTEEKLSNIKKDRLNSESSQCTFSPNIKPTQSFFAKKNPKFCKVQQNNNTFDKLYKQYFDIREKRKQKMRTLQNQQQSKIRQFKFKPEINQCSRQICRVKSYGSFISDVQYPEENNQEKDQSGKVSLKDKENTMKKQNSNCTFHPYISQNTKKLTQNLPGFFERLQLSKEKKLLHQSQLKSQASFSIKSKSSKTTKSTSSLKPLNTINISNLTNISNNMSKSNKPKEKRQKNPSMFEKPPKFSPKNPKPPHPHTSKIKKQFYTIQEASPMKSKNTTKNSYTQNDKYGGQTEGDRYVGRGEGNCLNSQPFYKCERKGKRKGKGKGNCLDTQSFSHSDVYVGGSIDPGSVSYSTPFPYADSYSEPYFQTCVGPCVGLCQNSYGTCEESSAGLLAPQSKGYQCKQNVMNKNLRKNGKNKEDTCQNQKENFWPSAKGQVSKGTIGKNGSSFNNQSNQGWGAKEGLSLNHRVQGLLRGDDRDFGICTNVPSTPSQHLHQNLQNLTFKKIFHFLEEEGQVGLEEFRRAPQKIQSLVEPLLQQLAQLSHEGQQNVSLSEQEFLWAMAKLMEGLGGKQRGEFIGWGAGIITVDEQNNEEEKADLTSPLHLYSPLDFKSGSDAGDVFGSPLAGLCSPSDFRLKSVRGNYEGNYWA